MTENTCQIEKTSRNFYNRGSRFIALIVVAERMYILILGKVYVTGKGLRIRVETAGLVAMIIENVRLGLSQKRPVSHVPLV